MAVAAMKRREKRIVVMKDWGKKLNEREGKVRGRPASTGTKRLRAECGVKRGKEGEG